ncbi:alpha amylase [Powellomyces hirtus]|nr:alpha amylase [Powellomyces hirtus]
MRWPNNILRSFVLFFLVSVALVATAAPVGKSAELIDYKYTGSRLSGNIAIQNLAYTKAVEVVYSVNGKWNDASQKIPGQYAASSEPGWERWTFAGNAPAGVDQMYVKYTVSGKVYYDPGNFKNHPVTVSPGENPTSVSSTRAPPAATTTTTPRPSVTAPPTTASPQPTTPTNPDIGEFPATLPGPAPWTKPAATPIPTYTGNCWNFRNLDSCAAVGADENDNAPASSENRRFQTPPRGDAAWKPEFQDYSQLTGYADVVYGSTRTNAVVAVRTFTKSSNVTLQYAYSASKDQTPSWTSSQVFNVPSSWKTPLYITVRTATGAQLVLDPLYFLWNNQVLPNRPETENGQKGAIAELFGWPYEDITKECTFLGKAGYMGVKIWPPTEHIMTDQSSEDRVGFRPWWYNYQPVSYRLYSRLGTREQLRDMITACRAEGVRVYADAVANHMSGNGNDIQNHRNDECTSYGPKESTAGSPYYTHGNTFEINKFTNDRPGLEFPAVPFGPSDFHCEKGLNAWTDGRLLSHGWLVGLTDLNSEMPYVRDRTAVYFQDLLSIGFSGFRIDAAKHMGPAPTAQALGALNKRMGGSFPADFITWMEVIQGGERDLLFCGGGPYSWYTNFDNELRRAGISDADIPKVKIWSSDYPKEHPSCGRWILPPSRFVIQNDDHDQQTEGSSSRDMADKGSVLVKEKDVAKHRNFETQLFTRRDGDWKIRAVLSSYSFAANGAAGFPDGLSDCSLYKGPNPSSCMGIGKSPAFDKNACGYSVVQNGAWIPGVYTRVHRDLSIVNAMRGWMGLPSVSAADVGLDPSCR